MKSNNQLYKLAFEKVFIGWKIMFLQLRIRLLMLFLQVHGLTPICNTIWSSIITHGLEPTTYAEVVTNPNWCNIMRQGMDFISKS
jgi:hypothetical protein